MIRTFLASLIVLSFFTGPAVAQPCGNYPYILTNGTTADASQVMGNFNHVLGCVNSNQVGAALLRGWLGGLTMSNNTTSPNTVIDTSAGVANSDDATTLMALAAFSKNANAAWAAENGSGCLDAGSTLAASTWYHLFAIARIDTGVVDQLCSTSATAPTMPTSYTKKRRIGSFRTNSSSQIIAFVQKGDQFLWKSPFADVSGVAIGNTAVMTNLTVPAGVEVTAIFRAGLTNSVGSAGLIFTSPSQNDQAPGSPHNDVAIESGGFMQARYDVITNTSGQIRSRAHASSTYWISTVGWIDSRGRFE